MPIASRTSHTIRPRPDGSYHLTWEDLLISSSKPGSIYTANYAYESVLLGSYVELYREVGFPDPEQLDLRANLERLADTLSLWLSSSKPDQVVITSGLRLPGHNREVGGAFDPDRNVYSYHMLGLAADVKLFRGAVQRDSYEVAQEALSLGVFDLVIPYKDSRHFTHVQIPRPGARPRGQILMKYYKDLRGVQQSEVAGVVSPVAGLYDPGDNFEEDTDVLDLRDSIGGDLLGADDEVLPLSDLPPPGEGEIDIGDLRFGSVWSKELRPEHLNQPTAITQQNVGAVGVIELIRTDTAAIVAENRNLPEVLLTLTVNGSVRDDVNQVLRPLVAMHRRFPFNLVRGRDLARHLLGITSKTDITNRLRTAFPSLTEDKIQMMTQRVLTYGPESIWIPVTMRDLHVSNQPGAPDLYQVHLTLSVANITPYVSNLMLWAYTQDALEWASYANRRSWKGVTVLDVDGYTGRGVIQPPLQEPLPVIPPSPRTDSLFQVESPHQSYVYKKFYRGLLLEYQPETQGGYLGISGSTNVYGTAYQISDPLRAMEPYRKRHSELQFRTFSDVRNRQEYLQRLYNAFRRHEELIDLLNNTSLVAGADRRAGEFYQLGKISWVTFGLGRTLGILIESADLLGKELGRAIKLYEQELLAQAGGLLGSDLSRYRIEGDDLQSSKITLTLESEAARRLLPTGAFTSGSIIDFYVGDARYEEVRIPYSEEVSRLQRAILRKYAHLIDDLFSKDHPTIRALQNRIEQKLSGAEVPLEEAFGSYLLTIGFAEDLRESNDVRHAFPKETSAILEFLDKLRALHASTLKIIASEKEQLREDTVDRAKLITQVLDFNRVVPERVNISFHHRFGDRPWDSQPYPVTQHLGVGSAEVTLEFTTNDRTIVELLADLQHSQKALAEKRKTASVIPPLVDVGVEGSLLRSLGIYHLSYRSHTAVMAENRPGYYVVTLELVQDETTLTRYEKWQQLLPVSTGPLKWLAPLVVPRKSDGSEVGWEEVPGAGLVPRSIDVFLSGTTDFDIQVRLEDEEGRTQTLREVTFPLYQFTSFLEFARGHIDDEITEEQYEAIRRVLADVLGSTAYQGGFLAGWYYLYLADPSTPLTSVVERLLEGNLDLRRNRSFQAALERLAADISRSAAFRSIYLKWVEETNPEVLQDVKTGLEKVRSGARKRPSCTPDLLMTDVRDAVTGQPLIGYEFPFGPGPGFPSEDLYLEDYQAAEQFRSLVVLKSATLGLDALFEVLETEGEDVQIRIQRYENLYNEAVSFLTRYAQDNYQLTLNLGSASRFRDALQKLQSYGVLSVGLPKRELTPKELVEIYRSAQTFKFVNLLLAYAQAQGADLLEDDSPILNVLESFQTQLAGVGPGEQAPIDAGEAIELLSQIKGVASDKVLRQSLDALVSAYAADAESLSRQLQFSDPSAEVHRVRMLEQLRRTWTADLGMRKAFPSYQLYVTGPPGSRLYRMLGSIYTYSAVQEIEIRRRAYDAGASAMLIISNLRQRIRTPEDDARRILIGDPEDDLALEVMPGTYMHVFLGYGPSVSSHMSFTGRVTSIQPGPITVLELASYGSTLNNPPNNGQGLIVDGKSGQSTIAQAILYTISQTQGLEGLGKGSFQAALDKLGRADRQIEAGENYLLHLILQMPRFTGLFPGGVFDNGALEKILEKRLGIISKVDIDKAAQIVLGSPRLYENINLVGGNARYGFWDWITFNYLNVLTNGKGWGWWSLPGESAWSQLQDQSLLFPDYIVTTRPYNTGISEVFMSEHPIRETLYFGPRSGYYIAGSWDSPRENLYRRLDRESVDSMISRILSDVSIETLYDRIFASSLQQAVISAQETRSRGAVEETVGKGLRRVLATISGLFPQDLQSAGEFAASLSALMSEATVEELRVLMQTLAPQTTEYIWSFVDRMNLPVKASTLMLVGQRPSTLDAFEKQQVKDAVNTGFRLQTEERSAKSTDKLPYPVDEEELLRRFREDLPVLAARLETFVNMNLDVDVASLRALRREFEAQGLPENRVILPVRTHHFCSTLDRMASCNIQAGTDDPDFANRISLRWPSNPDTRLDGYFSKESTEFRYTIQANPLILEDYIVEHEIYYPNLRLDLYEASSLIYQQLQRAAEQSGISGRVSRFLDTYQELVERVEQDSTESVRYDVRTNTLGEGEDMRVTRALQLHSETMLRIIRQLGKGYVRPKYQTVACNLLLRSLQHMYKGDVVLLGRPELQPYDVLHIMDYSRLMHGPVEVHDILHRLGAEGFYTLAVPKLACALRGFDETADLGWMSYASEVYFRNQLLSRAGSLFGDILSVGGTTLGLQSLISILGIAAFSKILWIVAAGYLGIKWIMNSFDAFQNTLKRFLGLAAEITDANPVVMFPLTYRGKPYTAGLTGAVGPASPRTRLRSSMLSGFTKDGIFDSNLNSIVQALREYADAGPLR
ncbi:MAG: hypothetical protein D6800_03180 [Candidatus Zixiibacteriota bacterium]|nr:MAG: hypothetical protein D6800_03180 [candidate division Zixibacteria bacterium]